MKFIKYIFIVFILLTSFANSQQCGWQWVSPLPQGNPLNDIYFADTLTGWAVGEYGVIQKTTNGGECWFLQQTGWTISLKSLYCSDSNNCWVLGYYENPESNAIILRTMDGGNTWFNQATITGCYLKTLKFLNSNIGWAVGNIGKIYKTTDGGDTWLPQISGTTLFLRGISFINSDTGWVVGDNQIILKTTNSGINWIILNSNTTYSLNDVWFVNSNTGFVVGDNGIMKSTNGGSSWVRLGYNSYLTKIRFKNSYLGMYIDTRGHVAMTSNCGLTWGTVSVTTGNPTLNSVFVFDTNSCVVVGNSGNVFKTTNFQYAIWTGQNFLTSNLLLTSKFVNSDSGIIAGTGLSSPSTLTTLRTTNGGNSWSKTVRNANRTQDVSFKNFNHGYASNWDAGLINKTTNSGVNWSSIYTNTGIFFWSIFAIDSNICVAAGDDGWIIKTTDGGVNWTRLTTGTTCQFHKIFFVNSNTGWAVGSLATIIKTTNGGTTWTNQISGASDIISYIFFINEDIGWVSSESGVIRKTTNGGSNWITQTSGVSVPIYNIFFVDENNGWFNDTYGNIFRTRNGGTSWILEFSNSNVLFALYATDTNNVWAGNEFGGILHYTYYVQKPILVSPINNKDTLSLHPQQLRWHKVDNAVSYSVQVSSDSNFISNLWNQTVQTDTTTLFSNLNYNITYYWRVQGTDADSHTSLWSDIWHFKTGEQVSQIIPLLSSWNMISSYINPADTTFADIMSQLDSNLLLAKDGLGNVFWNTWGIDDIQSWNIYNGYQMYVISVDTLTLTGTMLDPLLTPNWMNTGWYLISYLRDSILAPATALQSIQGSFIILKDGDGNVYWPDWGIDDIINMQPGKGYQIYMNQNGVLIYPEN